MRRAWFVAALWLFCWSNRAPAAVELISNGGFESGDFTGWVVTNLAGGVGDWFVNAPGSATPLSSSPTSATGAGGLWYAVTDQTGPGTHALSQSITVPVGAANVILSFDLFANDLSGLGPLVDAIGLDHNGPPNQHARVDLLSGGAAALDTGAGVLANFYLGVDSGALPNAFTHYSFDITSLVTAGGTFQLRFAEVDNQSFFNAGVDNVSLVYTPVGLIPEPASLTIWSILAGLGLAVGKVRLAARARR